jgi:hypothetical protein
LEAAISDFNTIEKSGYSNYSDCNNYAIVAVRFNFLEI